MTNGHVCASCGHYFESPLRRPLCPYGCLDMATKDSINGTGPCDHPVQKFQGYVELPCATCSEAFRYRVPVVPKRHSFIEECVSSRAGFGVVEFEKVACVAEGGRFLLWRLA